jgi:hypothetical protein
MVDPQVSEGICFMFETPLKLGWLFILVLLVVAPKAFSQSLASAPMIFDVRRSLPLEPEEPVFHDFYINAGPEIGFRKGQYVTVVRLIPVHDPLQNKQQATLTVTVAKLQVIQTERNITVARLQSELTDEERPTLEYEAVMIGDRIDPGSMTMEAPPKKKPKKQAAAEQRIETTTIVQVAVAAPPALPAPVSGPEVAGLAQNQNQNQNPSRVAVPTGAGEGKNASPSSSTPDMVRVPIPSAAASK